MTTDLRATSPDKLRGAKLLLALRTNTLYFQYEGLIGALARPARKSPTSLGLTGAVVETMDQSVRRLGTLCVVADFDRCWFATHLLFCGAGGTWEVDPVMLHESGRVLRSSETPCNLAPHARYSRDAAGTFSVPSSTATIESQALGPDLRLTSALSPDQRRSIAVPRGALL